MNFINLGQEAPAWGPSGQSVYQRTYARTKDDGSLETWPETVTRVVDGNLSLVPSKFIEPGERDALISLMNEFKIIPAGRHLWLSGVEGKQFINNCWVSGWTADLADHFCFTFDQLMQGGGVGANYSGIDYRTHQNPPQLHLVCDSDHADYEALKPYLSTIYTSDSQRAWVVEDTREGWVRTLRSYLSTDYDEVLIDLSRIRASGKKIKTFGGTSAGPVPLAKLLSNVYEILALSNGRIDGITAMDIDHAIAECVVSGNVRRSARMSVMHWKDPNIFKFTDAKMNQMSHWSTNISVEIDDEFIELMNNNFYGTDGSHAAEVFEIVTVRMSQNGEPGFWNSSLSNVGEPNEVTCTNPCGEITLPEWGVCCLGHVNLDAFAGNFGGLEKAHRLMARFLVRATFADIPDPKARAVQDRDRRIGVGHFGFHGYIAKQGIKFSEAAEDSDLGYDLSELQDVVRVAADQYAFQLRIPAPVKVTTVAPTGTIAKMPGRTEGIHPMFARYFLRRIRFSTVDPQQIKQVEEYRAQGYKVEDCLYSANTAVVEIPTQDPLVGELSDLGFDPDSFLEDSQEIGLKAQLAVQAMYQKNYADNAVSFTVNFDPEMYGIDDLRSALKEYLPRLKGTTVFPVLSRAQAPYEVLTRKQYEAYGLHSVDSGYDEECSTGACPVK